MRTTVELDSDTVAQAMKASGLRTKRAVIHLALEEMVKRRKQRELLSLRGTFRSLVSPEELRRQREKR